MEINQVSNATNYLVATQPTPNQIEEENNNSTTTINEESNKEDNYSYENNSAAIYVSSNNYIENINTAPENNKIGDVIRPEDMPTVKPQEPEDVAYSKNPNLNPAEVKFVMVRQEKQMEEFHKELMKEIVEQSELSEYSYLYEKPAEDLTIELLGNRFTGVAQEAVSDGGYYGVKNTSSRILDSVQSISNNNPDILQLLKEETEKGFQEFSQSYGGFNNIPDITKQSYNQIIQGFDELSNQIQ